MSTGHYTSNLSLLLLAVSVETSNDIPSGIPVAGKQLIDLIRNKSGATNYNYFIFNFYLNQL